jgi:hypothetical protein
MRAILYILTRPADELTQDLIAQQQQLADTAVKVVDLSEGTPDYDALVEEIFVADSIHVA